MTAAVRTVAASPRCTAISMSAPASHYSSGPQKAQLASRVVGWARESSDRTGSRSRSRASLPQQPPPLRSVALTACRSTRQVQDRNLFPLPKRNRQCRPAPDREPPAIPVLRQESGVVTARATLRSYPWQGDQSVSNPDGALARAVRLRRHLGRPIQSCGSVCLRQFSAASASLP